MGETLHNLQALRGVACLMVVGFHLWGWEQTYAKSTPGFDVVQWYGFAGVDLFFALSGFIITYTNARHLGRPAAVPGYLARRLWRIYPTFWVAMLLTGLAYWGVVEPELATPEGRADWVRWLTLLPGDPKNRYLGPAWTLTFDVMFYLAFAVVMLLPPRLGAGLLAAWAAVVLALAPGWQPAGEAYTATATSPYVLEFLGGCGVAWLIRRGARRWGRTAAVGGVLYAAAAIVVARALTTEDWMTVTARQHIRVAVFGPAAVLIVYGLAAAELSGTFRAWRWLRPVGDASYSIYLIHPPVGWHAVVYGVWVPHEPRLAHLGWLLGTFLACVAAGFALHYAVERPLLRLIRRRKRTAPAEPTVVEPVPVRRAA